MLFSHFGPAPLATSWNNLPALLIDVRVCATICPRSLFIGQFRVCRTCFPHEPCVAGQAIRLRLPVLSVPESEMFIPTSRTSGHRHSNPLSPLTMSMTSCAFLATPTQHPACSARNSHSRCRADNWPPTALTSTASIRPPCRNPITSGSPGEPNFTNRSSSLTAPVFILENQATRRSSARAVKTDFKATASGVFPRRTRTPLATARR